MATPKSAKKRVAKKSSGSKSSGFPAGRCGGMLRRGRYAKRVGGGAGRYMAGVLEYLTTELLDLAVQAMGKKATRMTPKHICQAVRKDDDLGNLLKDVTLSRGGVVANVHKVLEKKGKK